jgi:branched-subunit amino acid aminotransferase/4-amino-4-deoxychorismate lyase
MPGVLETLRVRGGRLPFLDAHLARMGRAIRALGLRSPERDPAQLVRPFAEMEEAVVRLEVSDGRVAVTLRGAPVPATRSPVVITAAVPYVAYPHKTTARACFEAAAEEARVVGADDALLVSAGGWIAEGTVWSVFWWEGERMCTPGLELGVLPGIARARVAELARPVEGRWPREALAGRSVFLANAVRGIVPLASLDGVPVPADPRTAELSRAFWPD